MISMIWLKKNNLSGLEKIKRLYLTDDEWSVENNLLTPTLKLKRPEVNNKYKNNLDSLYEGDKESN